MSPGFITLHSLSALNSAFIPNVPLKIVIKAIIVAIKNILEKIKNFECTHETGNIYKFIGYKPEIQYLNRKLELDLDKKYNKREFIKKVLKY